MCQAKATQKIPKLTATCNSRNLLFHAGKKMYWFVSLQQVILANLLQHPTWVLQQQLKSITVAMFKKTHICCESREILSIQHFFNQLIRHYPWGINWKREKTTRYTCWKVAKMMVITLLHPYFKQSIQFLVIHHNFFSCFFMLLPSLP